MPKRPLSHERRLAQARASATGGAPMRDERRSARERGYTWRWEKARRAYLAEHPLCAMCFAEQKLELATVVDHVIPHRGDMELFWNESNWQPLCKPHHDRKTATEDRAKRA